ncbi:SpoIIE family protein phosphatase [Streptomyces echinatus]|uniref:SpoIIE family protein phosphatase n=1 Tax=Streptomyces echinatus TaxID=67293 RepID=UPI0031E89884
MSSTNRLLIDLGADLFASCLYAAPATRRTAGRHGAGGHPPPLLRRPDATVRVLTCPLLGIDAGAVYPTTEVALTPGFGARPCTPTAWWRPLASTSRTRCVPRRAAHGHR